MEKFKAGCGCLFLMAVLSPLISLIIKFLLEILVSLVIWVAKILSITLLSLGGIALVLLLVTLMIWVFVQTFQAMRAKDFDLVRAIILPLLTGSTGVCLGLSIQLGLSNFWVIAALGASSISLITLLLYPPLNRRRLIRKYRQREVQSSDFR